MASVPISAYGEREWLFYCEIIYAYAMSSEVIVVKVLVA